MKSIRSRILIVDDNVQNLKLLAEILEQDDYEILLSMNGQDAIEFATTEAPDLILLDVMMPFMDGFEVCELLKNNNITKDIPVIFLTAKNEKKDIIKGLAVGGVDYLTKPFNQLELSLRIRNHLEIVNKNHQLKQTAELLERQLDYNREMSRELSRLDRLDTLGKMAASIAHEIRNPITSVRGFLQFLKGLDSFQEYKTQLEIMMFELDGANGIITEYLSLSKNHSLQFDLKNINNIIKRILPILEVNALFSKHRIVTELGDLEDISIDENEIKRLLLNLINNSLEAMGPNGRVTLRTFMDEGYVYVEVEDEGSGIPDHILQDMGTPFMTTKPFGTGLGLPVCFSIAEHHNAEITVKSNPGGTTFRVAFNRMCNQNALQECAATK